MPAKPGDSEEEVKHTIILKAQGAKLVGNESGLVIYKANLHSNIITNFPCRAVFECAYGPHMKFLSQEAQVYQTKLKDLQGAYIPRFLGLYYGKHPGRIRGCYYGPLG